MKSHSGQNIGFHRGLLILLLVAFAFFPIAIQGARPSEFQVKAAFLLKFVPFVEWPPTARNTAPGLIRIGLFGPDPFGNELPAEIPPDRQTSLRFTVSRLTAQTQSFDQFHILYFSGDDPKTTTSVLSRISLTPILTIGEGGTFLAQGGMIAFVLENESVRFLIHLKNAQKAGIAISSKLLSLAKTVFQ